jgi:hypothetical protein
MTAFARFLILQPKNKAANQITSYLFYLLFTDAIWKSIKDLMGQYKHEKSTSTKTLEHQI